MISTKISKFQCVFTVAEVAELYVSERAVEIVKPLGSHSMERHLLTGLCTSVLRPGICDTTGFHPRNATTSATSMLSYVVNTSCHNKCKTPTG